MQTGGEVCRGEEVMILTKLGYFKPQGSHGQTRKVYPILLRYNMDNVFGFIDCDRKHNPVLTCCLCFSIACSACLFHYWLLQAAGI